MDVIDNPRLGVISHLPTIMPSSEVAHNSPGSCCLSGMLIW